MNCQNALDKKIVKILLTNECKCDIMSVKKNREEGLCGVIY